MILERGHLREASSTELAIEGFLACVGSHVSLKDKKIATLLPWNYFSIVYLKTRSLEEALATVLTEVSPLVVVLFPVENGGVSVAELSPTVLALVYLPHPVGGQMLLQI